MDILKEIISKLNGYDPNQEYFDFSNRQRNRIVSILWDEVYSDYYLQSLTGKNGENPLRIEFETLQYLYRVLKEYEEEEEFELCDVTNRLIKITEHKIRKIDEDYANTKQENRRK